MGLLTSNIAKFRSDPRILKLPPYLSLLCMIGGIVWLLLLPLNEYSRQTYISENALLPGQVHTYFGGSEQNIFRAYKQELRPVITAELENKPDNGFDGGFVSPTSAKIKELFGNAGLKTATQRFNYTSSGEVYAGENVYAVLHAPRGDGTEAIVIVAAIKNIDNNLNLNGVTLLLSLARYFNKWSLWSKDIIFLVTPDSMAGPQAWIDAYYSTHNPRQVADLTLKSGSLQGAVCIDYPLDQPFESFHIAYDGINGQLPNLDLFNTAVSIASGQMGIETTMQFQHTYTQYETQNDWSSRLKVLLRGIASQALGNSTGPHSVFMPYHIDAITLTAIHGGWQDEMAFGRTVESICRSLNNLLEKLHQSFFFYLLMQTNRFVSIGSYLPSAMILGASYTIMAIYLWLMSGYKITIVEQSGTTAEASKKASSEIKSTGEKSESATGPTLQFTPIERDLGLPIALLTAVQLLSLIPLYFLRTLSLRSLPQTFFMFGIFSLIAPAILAGALAEMPNNTILPAFRAPTHNQYVSVKSLSLLLLGLVLTVLATLNFSLSLILGLLCAPLAFVDRSPNKPALAGLQYIILIIMSPVGASLALAGYGFYQTGRTDLLPEFLGKIAFAWNVMGSWGVVLGALCIWLPAWTIGGTVVASSWFTPATTELKKPETKPATEKVVKK